MEWFSHNNDLLAWQHPTRVINNDMVSVCPILTRVFHILFQVPIWQELCKRSAPLMMI